MSVLTGHLFLSYLILPTIFYATTFCIVSFKHDCQEKFVFPQFPSGSTLWPSSRFTACPLGETLVFSRWSIQVAFLKRIRL